MIAPQKQSPLLAYLIIVVGFVVGFLYNNQLDPATAVPAVPATLDLTSVKSLQNVSINYSILDSDQFKQLRVFGELPVQPGVGNNSNPFQ